MNTTTVSIITVCRNAGGELADAASSVLAALGPRDEWVIQDGASTDGSLAALTAHNDTRIRIHSDSDQGIYDAMNRAVTRAMGDYILFLGADDRLDISLDIIRHRFTDTATIYYGDVWRNVSRDRYAGVFDGARLARTNICHQAIFYPRVVFTRHRFDLRYPLQADWALNMACFSDPRLRFEYLDCVIATYSQHGRSSQTMDHAFQRDYRRLLKTHFPRHQRWRPALGSMLSEIFRAFPGVPAARQTPARH